VHAGNPVLDPVNVQAALGELDLLPLQVADLGGPQAVAIGDKDHGRVAMPIAAMLAGAVYQPVDLALGEVAPLDCQVYDAWCAFFGCRFHADKPRLRISYCMGYTRLLHSQILRFDRLRDQPARRAHPTPGKAVWSHLREGLGRRVLIVSRRSEHEPAGGAEQ